MQSIAGPRRRLVDVRDELRAAKLDMDRIEARHTLAVTGKNAEERKAQLTLALAADEGYRAAEQRWLELTTYCEHLEAQIEEAKDQRREREWAIRERLVRALERRGLEDDGRDGGFDAAADDDLADAAWESAHGTYNGTVPSDHMSGGELESVYYAGKLRPQPTYSMLQEDEIPF